MARAVQLFLGTKKGAWILRADAARERFSVSGPHFLGNQVHHVVLDPRDGRTLLLSARTGHLGPTVYRSSDLGATWKEAEKPPAFTKTREGHKKAYAVHHVFWLQPGHASEPGTWYAGTSPHGLFKSTDGGVTWAEVEGFNGHPDRPRWIGDEQAGTPDGPKLHSIIVDPRDKAHLYLSMSGGGTFESRDAGATWAPLNKGVAMDFMPPGEYVDGHDPHCVVMHPARPDRLYQQNHCGIYRLDRPGVVWERIGKNMPKETGDIGFPIVPHPRQPDTCWVLPMDGTQVWPRTSPGGRPAVFRTRDAGATWERQDAGLPREQAWFTVYRQAMAADARDPLGLYFVTTGGEVWASRDEGASWRQVAAHLPPCYSVTVAEVDA